MKKIFKTMLLAATVLGASSAPVIADEHGDWLSKERFQIRGRVIGVLPDGDGIVRGTSLETDVKNAVTPEVDVTYFFTDNIAAELIAATANHDVTAGTSDLGDAWIVPPTLTLQYHFTPEEQFSPYIGAGINYSFFWGEDADTGFNDLEVSGGFGFAIQAGFDYWVNDNWGFNIDAKYVDLEIDVDINQGTTALDAREVDLNPFIIGAGVSYRF